MDALFTQRCGFAQGPVTRLWEAWEKGAIEGPAMTVFQIS
jgi:hypothetical protein